MVLNGLHCAPEFCTHTPLDPTPLVWRRAAAFIDAHGLFSLIFRSLKVRRRASLIVRHGRSTIVAKRLCPTLSIPRTSPPNLGIPAPSPLVL